jgi:hypothetical protein
LETGARKLQLDAKATRWIYRIIADKNPLRLTFSYALWTAKMIGKS